jgi:hypothetical protein
MAWTHPHETSNAKTTLRLRFIKKALFGKLSQIAAASKKRVNQA